MPLASLATDINLTEPPNTTSNQQYKTGVTDIKKKTVCLYFSTAYSIIDLSNSFYQTAF